MLHCVRPLAFVLAVTGAAVCLPIGIAAQQTEIDALIAAGTERASPQVRRADLAVPLFRQALALADSADEPARGALASARLGAAYRSIHRVDEAIAVLERGTLLARRAQRADLEGLCVRTIGTIHIEGGRYDLATEYLERALSIGDASGDIPLRIAVLNSLSASARLQGRLADAFAHARAALALVDAELTAGRHVDPAPLFAVPFNVGKALADGGDYAAALEYFDRAFAAADANHLIAGVWHALFDTAEWYQAQGDLDRASAYYQRALDQSRRAESHDMEANTIRGLASVAEARGDLATAAAQYAVALRVYESHGLGAWIPSTLAALARTQLEMGRLAEADATVARAMAAARPERRPLDLVRVLLVRASVARARGDFSAAARDYDAARATAADGGLRPAEAIAAAGLARVAHDRGDAALALTLYRQAERTIGRLRARIPAPDQRATFNAAVHATFAGEFDLLMDLDRQQPGAGFAQAAFLALERERAQDLAAALVDSRIDAVASLSAGLQARQVRVGRRLAEIQTELMGADLPDIRRRALRAEQDDREREWDAVVASSRAAAGAPRFADADEPSMASLARLQRSLTPGEAFIAYASRRAFVVTRESFRDVALPMVEQLPERVDFFVRLLAGDDPLHAPTAGRVLSTALIAPVQAVLPEATTRLLISATGPIAGLPFAALPDPRHQRATPLLARYEVGYVRSATALVRLRATASGLPSGGLLAIANPPAAASRPQLMSAGLTRSGRFPLLPYAQQEVERAAEHSSAQATILTGSAATEFEFKRQRLREFSVLHFATHAVLDTGAPMRSAIVLGAGFDEDGLLQAREIFQLSLNADLVVLSACRTAAGRASTAQGMESLARAFVYAGARSVLGTLWEVDDRGTADLMKAFYDAASRGVPAVEALRSAQRDLMGPDPYATAPRWAGFVIAGDGAIRVGMLRPAPVRVSTLLAAGSVLTVVLTAAVGVRRHRRQRRATMAG